MGVTVVLQEEEYDCGLAGLAMLLNLSYKDVWAAGVGILSTKGLGWKEIQKIGDRLGCSLQRVQPTQTYLYSHPRGLLHIHQHDQHDHVVLWYQGMVIDPDGGSVWTLEEYVKTHKVTLGYLVIADS